MKNNRNTSLDLLRIICMMMVVGQHFFSHGGLVNDALIPGTVNWYLGNLMYTLMIQSVNCFVLLSGYFQSTSCFKLKRVISTWLQVVFYSVLLYLAAALSSGTWSVMELLKSGLVVIFKQYWFVTAYILMYAVSPFLNCAVRSMNRKMHLLCCVVLLGIFSVAHNLIYISDFGNVLGGSSFLWFCVLYLVAAYIRLYVPICSENRNVCFLVYIVCGVLIAVERFAAHLIAPIVFGQVVMDSFFYSNNSILNVAASIALFLVFRNSKVQNKWIQSIIQVFAPLAFGVYLIHDHHAVRPILWGILNPAGFAQSPWMIPYMLVCVVGIFVTCCLVEWCRQKLFRHCGIDRAVEKLSDRIQLNVENWLKSE